MELLLNDEVGQQKLLEELSQGGGSGGGGGGGGSTAFEFEAYYDEAGATSFGAWEAYSTNEVTFDELREAWGNKIPIRTVLFSSAESTTALAELEICSHEPADGGTETFGVVYPKGNELWFDHFEDWETKIILGLYKPE